MKPQVAFVYSVFTLIASSATGTSAQSTFKLTALSAFDNASRLECWALDSIPKAARGALNYDLGGFSDAFIGILPPRTYANATITHAPAIQSVFLSYMRHFSVTHSRQTNSRRFSVFLTGLVHIRIPNSTLPESKSSVWITGGKYGFLLATDTLERAPRAGHVTEFPGQDETVILEFATEGNKIPPHELLHVGPCRMDELSGL
jgi:hypothetical protein